jgi:hypothetical protein
MLMIALCAGRHMPTERLGPAGFNCPSRALLRNTLPGSGHHFELTEANMARIRLPPCRTILLENVSDLQLGLGQLAST